MTNRIEIGKLIADARKEKKLRQKDVAFLTGINTVVISSIENGRFGGSFGILEKCAEAVGLQFTLVPLINLPKQNDQHD